MRVYIDPQTGAISPDPSPGTPPSAPTAQERSGFSRSHEGLVETPLPDGGFKLELQGRFQSPLVGTVDADGKVRTRHLNRLPEPEDKR
jgi:hypothetical protein